MGNWPGHDAHSCSGRPSTTKSCHFQKKQEGRPAPQPTGPGRLKMMDRTIRRQGPGSRMGRLRTLEIAGSNQRAKRGIGLNIVHDGE